MYSHSRSFSSRLFSISSAALSLISLRESLTSALGETDMRWVWGSGGRLVLQGRSTTCVSASGLGGSGDGIILGGSGDGIAGWMGLAGAGGVVGLAGTGGLVGLAGAGGVVGLAGTGGLVGSAGRAAWIALAGQTRRDLTGWITLEGGGSTGCWIGLEGSWTCGWMARAGGGSTGWIGASSGSGSSLNSSSSLSLPSSFANRSTSANKASSGNLPRAFQTRSSFFNWR